MSNIKDGTIHTVNTTTIPQVVSIGAVHHDTLAHATTSIRRETSTPANFVSRPGGVATNIARVLSRLDVKVDLVGTVGSDAAAHSLNSQLDRDGIKHSLVCREGFATGQYLALHDPDGTLAAACVDDRILSEAPVELFDAAIAKILETSTEETVWFLDANLSEGMLVRLTKLITAKTPDARLIANAVSNAKASRLGPVLPALDCLLLNRGEAAALTASAIEQPIADLAGKMTDLGLRRFVLTDGASDALLLEDGELTPFSPKKTEVVDVTGAGDAMTAGIFAALAKGYSYKDAIPFGLSAAALTLRSAGALPEGMSWEALQLS